MIPCLKVGGRNVDRLRWGAAFCGTVLPKGPADGHLEPGDILIEVAGSLVTTFLPLEECLDDHVQQQVTLRMQRGGEVSHISRRPTCQGS